MDDRFNTIAGWTLFGGIAALGLASLSSHYFRADKADRPEKMGYAISGVEAEGGAAVKEVSLEQRLATGDAKKGEATFAKCTACHSIANGGANGIGPNLWAVVGDGIAVGRAGYAFSDGLKKHTGKWDFAELDKWLVNPKGYAEGTKMSFAGLNDGQDRANVILYLNAQGSNVPLPKFDAKAAAAAAAPAAGTAPGVVAVVAGDAKKGEGVFAKCMACHTIVKGGANGIGPNLSGIFGDAVGAGRGGYAFSDVLKAKGGKWDDTQLDAWLTSPAKYASGTKMSFAGLTDAQQRADVIAYLKAN